MLRHAAFPLTHTHISQKSLVLGFLRCPSARLSEFEECIGNGGPSSSSIVHTPRSEKDQQQQLQIQRLLSQYRFLSTAVSNRQWTTTIRKSAASTAVSAASSAHATHLRQRRPVINGEPVAFHINDLPSSSSSSSSLSTRSRNHRSRHIPTLSSSSSSDSQFSSVATAHALFNRDENQIDTHHPAYTDASASPLPSIAADRYDSDLVVVLDMDECLIHSQFLSPHDAQIFAHQLLRQQQQQQQQQQKSSLNVAQAVESFRFSLPDGDSVHVNVRPGLEAFLQAVTSKYETHVFTAAMAVYADPLLNHLDPQNTMFAGRWYREHCVYDARQQAYVKDLARLPLQRKQLDRMVLVDNNPLSFLANPSNGILVSSFYNDPHDTSLQSVWRLLQELDCQPDVRPHLEQRFGLRTALTEFSSSNKTLLTNATASHTPVTSTPAFTSASIDNQPHP